MTHCPSCAAFEKHRLAGFMSAGCIDCAARELANGPLFFASSAAGKLDDEYRAALQRLFGERFREGHQLVKSYAAKINQGAD